MSIEEAASIARDRQAFRVTASSQLSQVSAMKTRLESMASGSAPTIAVDIGVGDEVITTELAAASQIALKTTEAARNLESAKAALKQAEEEAAAKKNLYTVLGVLAAVAVVILLAVAGS